MAGWRAVANIGVVNQSAYATSVPGRPKLADVGSLPVRWSDSFLS